MRRFRQDLHQALDRHKLDLRKSVSVMPSSRRLRIGASSSSSWPLQLKPDQEKYWPAVEEAIRARAMARRQRLVNLVARATGQREFNPVELLRDRADALATRAANLKKLADAWQPLYASLDDNQKARLRLLTVYVLREMRDAAESRRLQSEDEYYDDSEE
jgi:hypothetical protein